MQPQKPLPLDVRPICARRQPPMSAILDALARLEPGQSLELTAPFEPVPLYDFLGARGFSHETREPEPGVWVILFTPLAGR